MCNKRLKERDIMCFSCDWWKGIWASMFRHENAMRRLSIILVYWKDFRVGGVAACWKEFTNLKKTLASFFFSVITTCFQTFHSKIRVRTLALSVRSPKFTLARKRNRSLNRTSNFNFRVDEKITTTTASRNTTSRCLPTWARPASSMFPSFECFQFKLSLDELGGRAGECVMNDNSSYSKKLPSPSQRTGLL